MEREDRAREVVTSESQVRRARRAREERDASAVEDLVPLTPPAVSTSPAVMERLSRNSKNNVDGSPFVNTSAS